MKKLKILLFLLLPAILLGQGQFGMGFKKSRVRFNVVTADSINANKIAVDTLVQGGDSKGITIIDSTTFYSDVIMNELANERFIIVSNEAGGVTKNDTIFFDPYNALKTIRMHINTAEVMYIDSTGKSVYTITETATAADPTRYHNVTVGINGAENASSDGLAAEYGRINWLKGDNSNVLLHGVEGVAASASADESVTLRGGYFRTYTQANADATGSTARTSIGADISARAGYSGGNAVQPESGTAFVGARIWMAPYFATSVANINNFHGLWLYNEHPTYDVTNAIYVNSVTSGGSWTNFLNFRNNADVSMFNVSKTGLITSADSLRIAGKAVIDDSARVNGLVLFKDKAAVYDSLRIGRATTTDAKVPTLVLKGDADSDGGVIKPETMTITLEANATPTSAMWTITSSQAQAYVFDETVNIGPTIAVDTQDENLVINGDADSDGTATTQESLNISLTGNATPTLATWDFTSTQSAGYKFDKNIDVSFGGQAIRIGADHAASTRTNSTFKWGALSSPHYTNAQPDVSAFLLLNDSGYNDVSIGGGSSSYNAATAVKLYTGATTTTVTGTLRMTINGGGDIGMPSATPASGSLSIGNKTKQMDLIVTRELTPAGSDSSKKTSVPMTSGQPTDTYYSAEAGSYSQSIVGDMANFTGATHGYSFDNSITTIGSGNIASFAGPDAELITATNDRTFGGAVTQWSGANWAVSSGVYLHTTGATTAATLANAGFTAGSIDITGDYVLTFTLANAVAAENITIALGAVTVGKYSTAGTYSIPVTAGADDVDLTVTPTSTFVGSIDNISLKRITDKITFANNGTATFTVGVGTGDVTISDATPVMNFKDTDATAGDVNASIQADATDTGNGTEDIDVVMQQQVAGTPTTFLSADADGVVTLGSATQGTTISGNFLITTAKTVTVGSTEWDVAGTDSIEGAVIAKRTLTATSLPKTIIVPDSFRAEGASKLKGNVQVGYDAAGDGNLPTFTIRGDADSDGGGVTTQEALTLTLAPNATPTLAYWGFTSTQGLGYAFDKSVTSGKDGQDGNFTLYSDQGATDYSVSLNPNATMTSAAAFYLPADEPSAQGLLTVSTGGVMSYVTSSSDLTGSISDETGSGLLVFATAPTFSGLVKRSVSAAITATSPGVQGDNILVSDINEVSVVGTAADAVTLPSAVAGMEIFIINNDGADALEIWPYSGDDLGAGHNTATSLIAGSNITFVAYDSDHWEVK